MKKLLSAIRLDLGCLPAVGPVNKPRRGAYAAYGWRVPALGSSGVFEGIGLHHYTSLKDSIADGRIEQIVYHVVNYAAAGFSGGSLQTTLGNTLGFTRSEKNMLLPNHHGLVGNLRAAYRPALVARLLRHIATLNDLDTTESEEKLLICVDGKWHGFDRERWVASGTKHPFRESFYPPASRVMLADLIDHTPYQEEIVAPDAMRWLKQESLLTPELELALKIAHLQRPRWTVNMLRDYKKRT
jgi:hypothetical protein